MRAVGSGRAVVVASGDHRFVHGAHPDHSGARSDGTRAVHHLSADASVLQCAPSDPAEPSWWRVVLDSVLFTVALLQGYEALHASAVATRDGVIAITAAAGGGKSTLLAELLLRGLGLMPGMTGHWQILGPARVPLGEMVAIDYLYVANRLLWKDVKILLGTVPHVLGRRGL